MKSQSPKFTSSRGLSSPMLSITSRVSFSAVRSLPASRQAKARVGIGAEQPDRLFVKMQGRVDVADEDVPGAVGAAQPRARLVAGGLGDPLLAELVGALRLVVAEAEAPAQAQHAFGGRQLV